MSGKKVYALHVILILNMEKWKPTISRLGILAEKQPLKIAKCCARKIIEGNLENKSGTKQATPNQHVLSHLKLELPFKQKTPFFGRAFVYENEITSLSG